MNLKAAIKSFKVDSRADGTFIIRPEWKGPKWTPEDGGGPGLFTRLATARAISRILNRRVKPTRPPLDHTNPKA